MRWPRIFSSRRSTPPRSDVGDGGREMSIDHPDFEKFLRGELGSETLSGAVVSSTSAMFNSVVFRCVDLISNSFAMLPWSIEDCATGATIVDGPLPTVLKRPNGWQTPFGMKKLMQRWVLTEDKGAVAVKVKSGSRVIGLIPVHPRRITVEQNADLTLTYRITNKNGSVGTYTQNDVLHLRADTTDGVDSIPPVRQAREAIGLSMQIENAAARLFRQGVMVGGVISVPGALSPEKRAQSEAALREFFAGADNAHKWMLMDNGGKVEPRGQTGADAQTVEMRAHQVEEILRFFGVPRPLAMVDETSWGSGVEQLATLFVRFGLAPWFAAWEQEFARACMTEAEADRMRLAIDEDALLRGSMKDQAEFFAKALGSGGSDGWLTPNEVRGQTGWGPRPGGNELPRRQQSAGSAPNGGTNVAS